MPRYFFDIMNGRRLLDPAGLNCSNDDDAMVQAIIVANQTAQDTPHVGKRHVAVLNAVGNEVFRVPIQITVSG